MSERWLCIHGHFYQPPRENAWLEAIEVQDSAYPYHDWNERIAAECYSPNAFSRILDDAGMIELIVNNYASISFNFGPTLLAWMEELTPREYQAVLEGDAESRRRYSGHGSAMAQVYNHIIMPLANERDKYTQVLWGIRDFTHRFGRAPEGMWLAETAVDIATLQILAGQGIRFTVLNPRQAGRVRPIASDAWQDVRNSSIDPSMPYRHDLPDGGSISLFFYDGAISHAVAFEGLLQNGERFAERLISGYDGSRSQKAQLVNIATDGETFGHHQRFGDMALAYALYYIEKNQLARLTNYGEFLAKHPPTHEVEIIENTSWSCVHGVERWRSDCGCNSGAHPGWNQSWRLPLRESLDWLRDALADDFENKGRDLLKNPWRARNEYIEVILDRSERRLENFFRRHKLGKGPLDDADRITVLKLLEMQRQALLMYTSCGWFFDEISGIETVQVIQYACRALQLHAEVFGNNLEDRFLEKLEKAGSNLPAHGDGKRIYKKMVQPAKVSLSKVAAHDAMTALFRDHSDQHSIYCYTVNHDEFEKTFAGRAKLAYGKSRLVSEITKESETYYFGLIHLGDHNLTCGVTAHMDEAGYRHVSGQLRSCFDRAEFTAILGVLNENFDILYPITSLFRDEQREILEVILAKTLEDAHSVYRQVYEYNVPLMRFLKNSDTPVPQALLAAGRFVINNDLRREFNQRPLDREKTDDLIHKALLAGIALDADMLEFTLRHTLENTAEAFKDNPENQDLLQELLDGMDVVYALPFDVNLRTVQNIVYDTGRRLFQQVVKKADKRDDHAVQWVEGFRALSRKLKIRES